MQVTHKIKSDLFILILFLSVLNIHCKNGNSNSHEGKIYSQKAFDCSIYILAILDYEEKAYTFRNYKDDDGYLWIQSKWGNIDFIDKDSIARGKRNNRIRIDTCLKINIDTTEKKYNYFDNYSKMDTKCPTVVFSHPIYIDNELFVQVNFYNFGGSHSYIYNLVMSNNKYEVKNRKSHWEE